MALTIDEMISGLEEQAANLRAFKEQMLSVSVDGAVSLKEIVARMRAKTKQGHIKLMISCGGKNSEPEIEWSVWDGSSWSEGEKAGKGPTLADAFKAFVSRSNKEATVESVAEELKS